jgi:hypothetical protein
MLSSAPRSIVEEQLLVTLQDTQRNVILSLLDQRMLVGSEEMQMGLEKIPMSDAYLRFRAALRAEGKAEGLIQGVQAGMVVGEQNGRAEGVRQGRTEGVRKALLTLLRTRRLSATAEERVMIKGCTDSKKLEQWIVHAVSAGSVGEVLGTNRKPQAARPRTKQRTRR